MRKKSPLYHLTLGLLLGAMIMPTQTAQAQFGIPSLTHDPVTHKTILEQKIEDALRHVKIMDNAIKQYTTLKGVLGKVEDLVTDRFISKRTMSDIGRTVRASFKLKEQVQAIATTRLTMLQSMDDRLRRGIFDPEADLRDLEDYLRTSIGRSSQDSVANLERLQRMDNTLERLISEWRKAQRDMALTQEERQGYADKREELNGLSQDELYALCENCLSDLDEKIRDCDALIQQYEKQIEQLESKIEERTKKYYALMDERRKFGEQVEANTRAWSKFNDELDGIQRALSKY